MMGALTNREPQARKEELEGFDNVDESSIAPIVDEVTRLQAEPHTP